MSNPSIPASDDPILVIRKMPVHLGGDLTKMADLIVRPGSISLYWLRWGIAPAFKGEPFKKVGGHVDVKIYRLPPWQNSVMYLVEGARRATVTMTPRQRVRTVEALKVAGFSVTLYRSGVFVSLA